MNEDQKSIVKGLIQVSLRHKDEELEDLIARVKMQFYANNQDRGRLENTNPEK